MRAVFGIDVSKVSSEVAILVNGEKVHGYTMSNDAIGFARLLGDLRTVHKPEIIFEATGVLPVFDATSSVKKSHDLTRHLYFNTKKK